MFDSGVSLKSVVEDLKNEVDISYPVPNASYVHWANALEQLLYREIIKEQSEIKSVFEINKYGEGIPLEYINVYRENSGLTAPICFEDIYAVYNGDKQLIKSTVASGGIFPDTYYKKGDCMIVNTNEYINPSCEVCELRIVYFVRPKLKTVSSSDVIDEQMIKLPIEFLDLMKAKLRAEAYKIANEDSLAAKWINDYNVLLETFKAWIEDKQPQFGM